MDGAPLLSVCMRLIWLNGDWIESIMYGIVPYVCVRERERDSTAVRLDWASRLMERMGCCTLY